MRPPFNITGAVSPLLFKLVRFASNKIVPSCLVGIVIYPLGNLPVATKATNKRAPKLAVAPL